MKCPTRAREHGRERKNLKNGGTGNLHVHANLINFSV